MGRSQSPKESVNPSILKRATESSSPSSDWSNTHDRHTSLSRLSRRGYRQRSRSKRLRRFVMTKDASRLSNHVATHRDSPADSEPRRPRLLRPRIGRAAECLRPTPKTHRVETAVAGVLGGLGARHPTVCVFFLAGWHARYYTAAGGFPSPSAIGIDCP